MDMATYFLRAVASTGTIVAAVYHPRPDLCFPALNPVPNTRRHHLIAVTSSPFLSITG
jgi:hypothetical protein